MPATSERQAKLMRAVAHGWKPKSKKSIPIKVARKFMTVKKSKKSKANEALVRAESLELLFRMRMDSLPLEEKSKDMEKCIKIRGIIARIRERRLLKAEMPRTYKSQKVTESFTTKKDAWRKGIVTNTPDKRTMYFTGNQTSADRVSFYSKQKKSKDAV